MLLYFLLCSQSVLYSADRRRVDDMLLHFLLCSQSVLYSAARRRADDMLLYRPLCCAQSVLYSTARRRADDMLLHFLLCSQSVLYSAAHCRADDMLLYRPLCCAQPRLTKYYLCLLQLYSDVRGWILPVHEPLPHGAWPPLPEWRLLQCAVLAYFQPHILVHLSHWLLCLTVWDSGGQLVWLGPLSQRRHVHVKESG